MKDLEDVRVMAAKPVPKDALGRINYLRDIMQYIPTTSFAPYDAEILRCQVALARRAAKHAQACRDRSAE